MHHNVTLLGKKAHVTLYHLHLLLIMCNQTGPFPNSGNNAYIFNKTTAEKVNLELVYQHFKQMLFYGEEDLNTFKIQSGHCGIKKTGKCNPTHQYFAQPLSSDAKSWHAATQNITTVNDSITAIQCEINLVNIQGLITSKKNKSQFLKLTTGLTSPHNILAITETWTQELKHYDAEILKQFPGYSLQRADRKDYDKADPNALQSRGGCLLLASPGITIQPIVKFSNGNCELLVTELPQLNMTAIVIYNPPKPNFNYNKFKEIVRKIEHYLDHADRCNKPLGINIMGDFNFPPRVVEWINSDYGTFPNQKTGDSDEKHAFQLLVDLMHHYGLFQIINKPTRENNILDLFLTDNPHIYQPCQTNVMKPATDHNLITLIMDTHTPLMQPPSVTIPVIPEISKYNLSRANKCTLRNALRQTNWDECLTCRNNQADINQNFSNTLVKCLQAAKVPLYKDYSKTVTASKEIDNLCAKNERLHTQLTHPTMRNANREGVSADIQANNQAILALFTKEEADKKSKLLQDITTNPKAFYKFADTKRKVKSKIGPLKSGDSYVSDPKQMADILSQQDNSVFSKPLTDLSYFQAKPHTPMSITDIDIYGR